MDKRRELLFRQIMSERLGDSFPLGIGVSTTDGVELTSFWYNTHEKRDAKYKTLGNMNDELLSLFDTLLNNAQEQPPTPKTPETL